ncbi:MAG TPA: ParB/RepB/Spo0J family partition protein [Dehalococcoidia bacterium]|nr:ParB/RepB/Spo0J family partition protein [Dehalococcoidia bacterium]
MTNRRGGLGRGLDALIPNLQPSVEEVDVDLIAPNPHQPRSLFDADALTELANSIREHGIIQPLIVSRPNERGSAPYQLIAGERRLLAARQAGLARVPVIVKEASPQALLELALVENLQRQDLGALEEAAAFKRLGEDFSLTQEAIATRVGRSRSAVANSLRLLALSEEMQASLARNEITAGHARALLGIDDPAERHSAWRRIVDGRLSVRDAETMSKGRVKTRAPARRRTPADVAALEEQLRVALGTRVELRKGRRGGRLVVYFFSDEELEAIIEKLS